VTELFFNRNPELSIRSFHTFIFDMYNYIISPPYWELYGNPPQAVTDLQKGE